MKHIIFPLGVLLLICFLVVIVWAVCGALNEKQPEHPLDYHNYQSEKLTEKVITLEQGRIIALEKVLLYKGNAKLIRVFIELTSAEINCVHYRFEFPYVTQENPHGFSWVGIDFPGHSITPYSRIHDYDKITEIPDIIADNQNLGEIYDRAIEYAKQNLFLSEKIKSITIYRDKTEIVIVSEDGIGKTTTIDMRN